jgi:hypothetical protein
MACAVGCNSAGLLALPGGQPAGQDAIGIQSVGTNGSDAPGFVITPAGADDVSLLEQLALERINRARLRPGLEAAAAGIAINEGLTPPATLSVLPKQAVAMNPILRQTAVSHSRDMLNRNYFDHNDPGGSSPFDRMRLAGFAFVTAGENLAWRGTTATLDPVNTVEMQHDDLFIDAVVPGRGHRLVMLDARFREVGIGIVRGSFRREDGTVFTDSIMQTQDFGTSATDGIFVLGVVYNDANRNGQFDYGEGSANSPVTLNDMEESTNNGGGYSFRVTGSGNFTLRFASGQTRDFDIQPGDANIKVDLVDGRRVIVNLGLTPLN